MGDEIKVGDQLWYVARDPRRFGFDLPGKWITVTKVGRKWVTTGGAHRWKTRRFDKDARRIGYDEDGEKRPWDCLEKAGDDGTIERDEAR